MDSWRDCKGIPFEDVLEAINKMEYASTERVMFGMLALTGCRIMELGVMTRNKLIGNILYWRLGKNQRGTWRQEYIPSGYIEELKEYWKRAKIPPGKIFAPRGDTFSRYFNKFIRPRLNAKWRAKRPDFERKYVLGWAYKYQLKGLRKNFQTLEFGKQLKKWKDGYIAMQFTSKRMKHHSDKITAFHYIEDFEPLQIERYQDKTMAEILKGQQSQKRILDWC